MNEEGRFEEVTVNVRSPADFVESAGPRSACEKRNPAA